MTGPPKKPTELKLLQGTFRGDRATNEPRPEIAIPTLPKHLNSAARAEWKRISRELFQLNLLTRIDRAALAAYCSCYAMVAQLEKKCIDENGNPLVMVKTSAGNMIENPYFSGWKRCLELMHKYLVEFGMTPASRARINIQPQKNESADPAKKYLS